jgi:hypothetical protein
MRKAMLVLAAVALSHPATAADEGIDGTYKLVSRTRTVLDTGQVITLDQEQGFITYGKDGRMMVLSVRGNRPKAESIRQDDRSSARRIAPIHDRVWRDL